MKITSFTANPVTSKAAGDPVSSRVDDPERHFGGADRQRTRSANPPHERKLLVHPITNSIYTLTAYGPGGQTVSTTISVFVR